MVKFSKIIERFPTIIPRDKSSNIFRYVEAHQEEVDSHGLDLKHIRNSHYIDTSSGDDLDRVGAMFGPLGTRNNRTDQEYRIYLKSLVQVYNGAGTVDGIKSAVGAGLGIPKDTVKLVEEFDKLQYRITLSDWSAHAVSTIDELVELADPSGVAHASTDYNIGVDESESGDSVSVTEGQQTQEGAGASDASGPQGKAADVADTAGGSDSVSSNINTVAWDVGDWDTMYWD